MIRPADARDSVPTFSEGLRKMFYTTNAKSLNSVVRRAVHARGNSTSHQAEAAQRISLATREASRKWHDPKHVWHVAKRELAVHIGDRFDASVGCASDRLIHYTR